jgi:phosphoribosylanthranilate isomerase
LIQLHGDETVGYCEGFHSSVLIKALSLETGEDIRNASLYPVRALLVDARLNGLYGGTGKQASWSLAARLGGHRPIILAGGLNSENIALAVREVRPCAVDINSGVEDAPGKKNAEKVKDIIRIIRKEESGQGHEPVLSVRRTQNPSRTEVTKDAAQHSIRTF